MNNQQMTEAEAIAAARHFDPESLYLIALDCDPLMQELERIVMAKRIERLEEQERCEGEQQVPEQKPQFEQEDRVSMDELRERFQFTGVPFLVFEQWEYAYAFRGYCLYLRGRACDAMRGSHDEKFRNELSELIQEAYRFVEVTETILWEGFGENRHSLRGVKLGHEWEQDLKVWMRRNRTSIFIDAGRLLFDIKS